ncbi:hypothetical protein HYALB_00004645 [Hymenoscyphus albidus]|uniref:Uncharacterized protein n=1 Tax=Hymenoscyphus albidus TaxID=595503 RepID=A0A9N9Q2P8_9HELO|nr:hypothetical protein HYALB_00004645 [Hymenoscyphus albidus]
MGVFSSKPVQPVAIPSDTVVELGPTGDTRILRPMVIDFTLCFDEVLDPKRLRGSLEALFNHGNWRKLGARLRLNVRTYFEMAWVDRGRLEYHFPAKFDGERPAFSYTHVEMSCNIKEYPLASQIPKATPVPTLQPDCAMFRSLSRDSHSPKRLEDWLISDIPQLYIHIVSLSDATMVAMTAMHTFLDANARVELVKAWVMSLNGRLNEVPEIYGFDFDPLEKLGKMATEESVLERHRTTDFGLFWWLAKLIIQSLFWKQTIRTICISPAALKKLKSQALTEVQALDSKAFLSDGDIISAWWTKYATLHLAKSKDRTVTIVNAFSMRPLLEKPYPNPDSTPLLPEGKPCLALSSDAIYTLIRAHEILAKPLSHTALSTRAQVEAMAAMLRSSKVPLVYGGSKSSMLVLSNRSKAKFYDVFDFSGAVVKVDEHLSKPIERIGRPAFIYALSIISGLSVRDNAVFEGPDGMGNLWLTATMDEENWAGVQEAIHREWEDAK